MMWTYYPERPMKIARQNETKKFENGPHCVAYEYTINDPDINGAVGRITGRYPEQGRVVNEKVKEMVYVIAGSGSVTVEGTEYKIAQGDVFILEPGEKYFWDGDLTVFMPCTPSWYAEQHKEVA